MPSLPIRILFCHHSADVGGGSDRSLFELVTALPKVRFAALMVLRTGDPMAPAYRAAGIDVAEMPLVSPRRTVAPLAAFRFLTNLPFAAWRIARMARRFGADLIHVNTLTNAQGALAARLAGRPLVWHVRELMPASRGYAALTWLARRWAARIIAISKAVADVFPGCAKVEIVPNGIALEAYQSPVSREAARTALELDGAAHVVALVGRIEPWKGQHVLIEAAPEIMRHLPGTVFLLAGNPAKHKPGYAKALKARCRALDIAHCVRFLGHRGDVATLLAASDVLVSCSVTPEPFGRTLVEAMAAATPVIATRGGGPDEIIEDGDSGLLVAPGDAGALAEAVCALLGDPARAAAMAEKAKTRAETRYGVARLAEDMARVFEECVGREDES